MFNNDLRSTVRSSDFDKHFAKAEKNIKRGFVFVVVLGILQIVGGIGLLATLLWVVGHFIVKYW